jgi:hypothetical protein
LGPSPTPLLLQALAFHIAAVRVPQTVDVVPVAERTGVLIDDAAGLNVQDAASNEGIARDIWIDPYHLSWQDVVLMPDTCV